MTEIDGRKRWTWSARGRGNRISYALVAAWLVWLVAGRPPWWIGLPVAVVAYVAQTVYFRWRDAYPGTDRQP